MKKHELLAAMESARAELLEAIAGLSDEQLLEPGVVGNWSVRDVLQHISLWEAELVRLLAHVEQGRKPSGERWSGNVDIDALNAKWHAETAGRLLDRVQDDFHAVRRQTLRRLETLSDGDLERVRPQAWLRKRPLWQWIAEETFEHDAEHAAEILAWRRAQAG
jgi:uncharacterized damage-inducible protein DinB